MGYPIYGPASICYDMFCLSRPVPLRVVVMISPPKISYDLLGLAKEKTRQRKRFTRDPQQKYSTVYYLLRFLVLHSCIDLKSFTYDNLDEKSIDTGLMKFSGLCPSVLSWYMEFANAFSSSTAHITTKRSLSMKARDR
ncbi:hypothetical protein MUK42_13742 [Musa troglodytarum]|uniref:Uncharacterized protein n=1 Tax=Musa troglodytarum TaxID=320322 RepID=A0A9E7L2K0_9LILI|nr:hypothetical protein MUK42_13742 [Musa troglodytarum]